MDRGELSISEATTDTKTPMGETKSFKFAGVLPRDFVAHDVMSSIMRQRFNWKFR